MFVAPQLLVRRAIANQIYMALDSQHELMKLTAHATFRRTVFEVRSASSRLRIAHASVSVGC